MPNGEADRDLLPRWPGAIVFVLVAWGVVKTRSAPEARRPTADPSALARAAEANKTHARLWQDPLATVVDHANSRRKEAVGHDGTCRFCSLIAPARTGEDVSVVFQWFKERKVNAQSKKDDLANKEGLSKNEKSLNKYDLFKNDDLLILPVLVDSSPFAEAAETRLRNRQAVLSALALAGFGPLDGEHLPYFQACQKNCSAPKKTCPNHSVYAATNKAIPFEWYLRKTEGYGEENPKRSYVCVLWVGSDVVTKDAPLTILKHLVEALSCEAREIFDCGTPPKSKERSCVRIMGPSDSDMLADMLSELMRLARERPCMDALVFYSTQATARGDWDAYVRRAKESSDSPPLPELKLTHYVGSDERLIETLAEEFRLRPNGRRSKPKLALVSEWDTTYARSLVEAVDRLLGRQWEVRKYYYTKGLDGRITDDDVTNKPDTSKSQAAPDAWSGASAVGRSQIDHLGRLVQHLQEESPPDVVLVAGADVYDKLLILRAMRDEAPQALFATTDIDARLFDPGARKFTRNLVVASHFDLMFDLGDAKERLSPFRDGFQTALCRGVLSALEDSGLWPKRGGGPTTVGSAEATHEFHRLPPPVLHEIGLQGANRLPTKFLGDSEPPDSRATSDGGRRLPRFIGILLLLASLFLLLLRPTCSLDLGRRLLGVPVRAAKPRASGAAKPDQAALRLEARAWLVVAGVALFAALAGLVWADSQSIEREPFAFFEGISTWPTEFLRLLVFVLSVYATMQIQWTSNDGMERVEKYYFHSKNESDMGGRPDSRFQRASHRSRHGHEAKKSGLGILDRFMGWLDADRLGAREIDPRPSRLSLDQLWGDYSDDGRLSSRIRRVVPFVVIYWLFAQVLMAEAGGAVPPVRGQLNATVDFGMLMISVVSLIWIIFYVWDATRLCARFIDLLQIRGVDDSDENWWPDQMIERLARREGVSPESALHAGKTAVGHYAEVCIVRDRTETVSRFIYAPFGILLLMFLSRYSIFDNWSWPPALVFVFVLNAVLVVSCEFAMRSSAESMRGHALRRMRNTLEKVPVDAAEEKKDGPRKQIERLIEKVEKMNTGAFCNFLEIPALRAILIPFGGYGAVAVLDQLRPYF